MLYEPLRNVSITRASERLEDFAETRLHRTQTIPISIELHEGDWLAQSPDRDARIVNRSLVATAVTSVSYGRGGPWQILVSRGWPRHFVTSRRAAVGATLTGMLTPDELTTIIREVARGQGRTLEVHSVAATDGGSGRAEILVTVSGCHQEPCRLLINASRESPAEFETEFRAKFASALERHDSGGDGAPS